jgi:hypothetical protein
MAKQTDSHLVPFSEDKELHTRLYIDPASQKLGKRYKQGKRGKARNIAALPGQPQLCLDDPLLKDHLLYKCAAFSRILVLPHTERFLIDRHVQTQGIHSGRLARVAQCIRLRLRQSSYSIILAFYDSQQPGKFRAISVKRATGLTENCWLPSLLLFFLSPIPQRAVHCTGASAFARLNLQLYGIKHTLTLAAQPWPVIPTYALPSTCPFRC